MRYKIQTNQKRFTIAAVAGACCFIITAVLLSAFFIFAEKAAKGRAVSYAQFIEQVDNGDVRSVLLEGRRGGTDISAVTEDGRHFTSFVPPDSNITDRLESKGVQIRAEPESGRSFIMSFMLFLPLILAAAFAAGIATGAIAFIFALIFY